MQNVSLVYKYCVVDRLYISLQPSQAIFIFLFPEFVYLCVCGWGRFKELTVYLTELDGNRSVAEAKSGLHKGAVN